MRTRPHPVPACALAHAPLSPICVTSKVRSSRCAAGANWRRSRARGSCRRATSRTSPARGCRIRNSDRRCPGRAAKRPASRIPRRKSSSIALRRRLAAPHAVIPGFRSLESPRRSGGIGVPKLPGLPSLYHRGRQRALVRPASLNPSALTREFGSH